ncbi:MAG: PTS fructose transporter subunit IIC [Anaerolineaceae bacterium]|nr:PTS fructose transporter subunit IIC [Anaerolineaceae bacterium]
MKGKDLQRHLLTGVSYFIPFVVAGGILIALGFLFGGIYVFNDNNFAAQLFFIGKDAFGVMIGVLAAYIAYSMADRPGIAPGFVGGMVANRIGAGFLGGLAAGFFAGWVVSEIKKIKLPQSIKSLMPVIFIPLFGTAIVGLVMFYIVGPPATWLNELFASMLANLSVTGTIILAVVLGAMMAFDMGGPVNKAAYTFALAASENNNWVPMAAVMVGGMVPPLSVAFAMLIAKDKFSEEEHAGLAGCFIGAATFITEFAIPYAAGDPLRVIPSIMVGSAVGSAVSYLAGISLMAPHGGLFIFALANKPLMWILSIIIGGVAGAAMLVWLKPTLKEEEKAKKSGKKVGIDL